jgi:hypothetical protein
MGFIIAETLVTKLDSGKENHSHAFPNPLPQGRGWSQILSKGWIEMYWQASLIFSLCPFKVYQCPMATFLFCTQVK